MLRFFYPLLRFFLFKMDAEKTHDLTLKWLKKIAASPWRFLIRQKLISDPLEVFGITFPNKLGLAAGLDKNAECIDAFALMGFGHIEVGTVTPRPQPGNAKPRLFRLTKQKALINRFGFNNQGVDQVVKNIQKANYRGVLGINIGKNFDTPVEKAVDDYLLCMQKVYPYASYISINISSPNTANLRQLQFGEALNQLLAAIKKQQQYLAQAHNKTVPVLVKVAPDLNDDEISALVTSCKSFQIDGLIATNTTLSRQGVKDSVYANEQGGLSGAPVFHATTCVLQKITQAVDGAFPIIGVGGINSAGDAKQKLQAGAALLQIYSGFIYRGPKLIQDISRALKS